MPPKIRELESKLRSAGFVSTAAKGSHRKWRHEAGTLVIMSGSEGNDAKPYQIKDVEAAIAAVKSKRKA